MEKKAKKTTKSKKKVKKIQELSQAHGKNEELKPTTLDQVWGDDGLWRYDTHEEVVYQARLKEMTRIDMQTHATKVGLIPVENRDILEKRLLREFRRHVASYNRPTEIDNTLKISNEARRILEEGR